jgi:hypothetical protein
MTNVFDLVREQVMSRQHPQPTPEAAPTPTETAQIVINFDAGAGMSIITRYKKLADAERVYDRLIKAWKDFPRSDKSRIHYVAGDMWGSDVDVSRIVAVSLIDWKRRDKFIPK